MASRLQLQSALETIIGSRNVYFQPPESLKLKYPCVLYWRDNADTTHANNMPYTFTQHYSVTLVEKIPDSPHVKAIAMGFPMIRHARTYVADNLYHDVFDLYY